MPIYKKGPDHPFWQKCLSESLDARHRYIRNLEKWHPEKTDDIAEEQRLLKIEQSEYRLFCDDFQKYMESK